MPRPTMRSFARLPLAAATALALAAAFLVSAPAAQAAPDDVRSRDYTGDGRTDILVVNEAGQLSIYAGDGNAGWTGAALVGPGWSGFTVVTPGDLDNDGRADIVAVSDDGRLYFYAGTGNGFVARVQIGHGWQNFTNVFSPGDFNGDGEPDIIATTASGEMYIYYGNGAGRTSGSDQIGFGWDVFTDVMPGGDVNGDGRADILARDAEGRLFAYYGREGTTMSARDQVGNGWGPFDRISSVGDFTGDGHTDVFAVHERSGEAWVYPGNGRSGFGSRILVGTDWREPTTSADASFSYERTWLRQSLNTLRAQRGVAPVARSAELDARAQAWAQHMAQTQNMYHTPGFSAQMSAAGWSYKSELIVRHGGGRNMATSAILTYMHNWWVASPNHYPWMISPNYTHVGHGYFMGPGGPYAVTVLGGR
ncbi:FG-GAP-like repeat-containing protein [Georgenia wangjunii]|uniref:FG-GAP-like repeat-containing protein n=1 Tax=Georgenia wangjunii TaxID=3117730 RepID=UPI002F26BD15